ncbi:MAG: hypothetical protein Fues2KO_44710 [Fuerstiella sp.]
MNFELELNEPKKASSKMTKTMMTTTNTNDPVAAGPKPVDPQTRSDEPQARRPEELVAASAKLVGPNNA